MASSEPRVTGLDTQHLVSGLHAHSHKQQRRFQNGTVLGQNTVKDTNPSVYASQIGPAPTNQNFIGMNTSLRPPRDLSCSWNNTTNAQLWDPPSTSANPPSEWKSLYSSPIYWPGTFGSSGPREQNYDAFNQSPGLSTPSPFTLHKQDTLQPAHKPSLVSSVHAPPVPSTGSELLQTQWAIKNYQEPCNFASADKTFARPSEDFVLDDHRIQPTFIRQNVIQPPPPPPPPPPVPQSPAFQPFGAKRGITKSQSLDPLAHQTILSDLQACDIVRSVSSVLEVNGGKLTGPNLESILARDYPEIWKQLKYHDGGMAAFLEKFPDQYVIGKDASQDDVILLQTGSRKMTNSSSMVRGAGAVQASQSITEEVEAVEVQIIHHAWNILSEANSKILKAVELANMLRSRVGTDALAKVREKYGGLLTLLESHPSIFNVMRIPKSDNVALAEGSPTLDATDLLKVDRVFKKGGRIQPQNNVSIRCLHVGNVAAHLTEGDLWAEFSKYGKIEVLKLVAQKGRRFAFVNYSTHAEAEEAKNSLSKSLLWRSNIAYAKRESMYATPASGGKIGEPVLGSKGSDRYPIAQPRPSRFLWVANAAGGDVFSIFQRFGEIVSISYTSGRCSFIEFAKEESCVAAHRHMQGKRLRNATIEVGFA